MRIDLLLLAFSILGSLLLDLVLETEQHLVTVCFILDLLLLDHLSVFELQQLLLGFQQGAHLLLLLVQFLLIPLVRVYLLRFESRGKRENRLHYSHGRFAMPFLRPRQQSAYLSLS